LFQVIYNVNYYSSIDIICKLANIKVAESTWVEEQKAKYLYNIAKIENAKEELGLGYPTLFNYIKKHLYLLKEMNNIGITNILSTKEAIENESTFFVSTKFLEQELNSTENVKNQSTISRILNMF
jgi:hypothetical protein